jgi:tetratricopeptide (TPR) repeat protein
MARGQAEYFSGRPREALAYYEELERNYLDPNDGYNRIRILQWRAIARLSERRHGDQAMRDLIRARDLSRRQQRWEIVRSCELYRGEHLRDTPAGKRILTQLYFGSPYPRLRERLLARLGGFAELPAHYDRVCGKAGPKPPVLETRNGLSTAAHGAHLKEGQLLQRLLQALNMDYYSPLSVAEIHEAVFPGEYYNPDSSRDRVHQSLKRLRQWLATHRIPLTVAERDHLYVLEGAPACIVRETALAAGPTLRLQASVNQLHKAFGSVAFSSREVAQALGVSLRSANDCLREALDSGLVHQEGRGPACRYRVGTAT